jgi:LDH2 family malate/lactate/ureidoglycolate dehydrogenase
MTTQNANQPHRLDAEKLRRFISGVLQAMEAPAADADFVGELLVEADLRGVDSHGATRLPGYVGMIDNGHLNTTPDIKVLAEFGATTHIDGDLAFGMLVARKGMRMAMEKAREHGIAISVTRNMTHTGLVGYYTMMAASEGLIGLAMNNGPTIVPPYGGTQPLYATNPFSVSFPAAQGEPIVLDMATTMVAAGRLRIAEKQGLKVPTTWGLDREGRPTDDPTEILQHGHLQWAGGYKGFGIATMIESLTGLLSGGIFGLDSPPLKHFGQDPLMQSGCYIAIDPSRFVGMPAYGERVDRLTGMIKSVSPFPGGEKVMVAGQQEFERKREHLAHGIPTSRAVYGELEGLSRRFGVAFDVE